MLPTVLSSAILMGGFLYRESARSRDGRRQVRLIVRERVVLLDNLAPLPVVDIHGETSVALLFYETNVRR